MKLKSKLAFSASSHALQHFTVEQCTTTELDCKANNHFISDRQVFGNCNLFHPYPVETCDVSSNAFGEVHVNFNLSDTLVSRIWKQFQALDKMLYLFRGSFAFARVISYLLKALKVSPSNVNLW